jgi:hypothetical protein
MGVKLGLWPARKGDTLNEFLKDSEKIMRTSEGISDRMMYISIHSEKLHNIGSTNSGIWGLGVWKYKASVHNHGTVRRWVVQCTSRGLCCPRKGQIYPQNTRMAGHWDGLNDLATRNIFCPCLESNPDSSVVQHATIVNHLSWQQGEWQVRSLQLRGIIKKYIKFWQGSLDTRHYLGHTISRRKGYFERRYQDLVHGCVNWIKLAHNTVSCLDLGKTVMNRWGSIKGGELCDNLINYQLRRNWPINLILYPYSKGKGKAVPLQAWSGPEDSSKLRFPDYMTTAQNGGKVVSLRHRPPLPAGNAPGTNFY